MDLFIDRDELSRGLARVQGIIERRSTHPILSHVLLCASSSGMRITATDTEVAFIGEFAANVQAPGELAVDATHLFQVVRALPEPTLQLTAGAGNRLEIRSGRAFFKLNGIAASKYPPLQAFDGHGSATLSERDLRGLVERTAFAVATDDARYGLNGAHLEAIEVDGKQLLRMVATDGHRLSAAEAPFEGELAITPNTLVPRKALAVMRKLLEGGDDPVEMAFGEGAIRLSRPGQTFWFRLLDGQFPAYRELVQNENKYKVLVGHGPLGATLKRASILVQDRTRAVQFRFDDTELEIQLHNVDRGEVRETVPIELQGEALAVGFNVRYLQEVLAVMRGDRVSLELAHPLAPCLVSDPDDASAFFVVMPMRLD